MSERRERGRGEGCGGGGEVKESRRLHTSAHRAQACSDHPIVCRTLREEGGVGNFCHAFIAEAHTIARAHIRARGGNACLKYRFTQFKLTHNSARNHAYVLCSILGDAALVVPATVSRSPRDSA